MTDTKRLDESRRHLAALETMCQCAACKIDTDNLRWLIAKAEACERAEKLAADEPTVVERGPTFDAGYASARNCFILQLRKALKGNE